jgi:phosphopantothenoylcysteine decarboxylase/phosphopantothenate--cysteine ligase
MSLAGQRILLVIAGGIAAYKSLDLIRRLRERSAEVRCILTAGGARFVTPLAVASLAGDKVYGDLFSLTDEAEMGHIRLSREADLVVVAPATADLMAKMAHGLADDLASTALLATDKRVLIAPAMNPQMWAHPATERNLARLRADGIAVVGPNPGDMACGEVGAGRMAEPLEIVSAVETLLSSGSLVGRRALVTSGPTFEAIDPVRFIGNRSSGKQGHAIAQALADAGCAVTLISGPVALADPAGVQTVHVESALEMLEASIAALPVDIAVCAAAVADWRPAERRESKVKKGDAGPPRIELVENRDILARLSAPGEDRPRLVIGFAAETDDLLANATAKLKRKGCDWLIANAVAGPDSAFGGDLNRVHLLRRRGYSESMIADVESWPPMPKSDVARRIVEAITGALSTGEGARSEVVA